MMKSKVKPVRKKGAAVRVQRMVRPACELCRGSGTTDGALGYNGQGPCPRCQPETWGPYTRKGDWYVLTPLSPSNSDYKQMLRALGKNIKAARLKTGISIGAMAKLSGVSKGNCSKIEHGGNVTALCLYRLCWSLGAHPRDVLPEYRPNDRTERPALTET